MESKDDNNNCSDWNANNISMCLNTIDFHEEENPSKINAPKKEKDPKPKCKGPISNATYTVVNGTVNLKLANCKHYTPEFRQKVLDNYYLHGLSKTMRMFNVDDMSIYRWKKHGVHGSRTHRKGGRNKKYDAEFREKALLSCKEIGVRPTARKFKMSFGHLYSWVKEYDPTILKRKWRKQRTMFSVEFKREVVKFWQEHGLKRTLEKFEGEGLNRNHVRNWADYLALPQLCPYTGESVTGVSDEDFGKLEYKLDAIEYANKHGFTEAAKFFNVERWKISYWKVQIRSQRWVMPPLLKNRAKALLDEDCSSPGEKNSDTVDDILNLNTSRGQVSTDKKLLQSVRVMVPKLKMDL